MKDFAIEESVGEGTVSFVGFPTTVVLVLGIEGPITKRRHYFTASSVYKQAHSVHQTMAETSYVNITIGPFRPGRPFKPTLAVRIAVLPLSDERSAIAPRVRGVTTARRL
jgi:hypothetical protein